MRTIATNNWFYVMTSKTKPRPWNVCIAIAPNLKTRKTIEKVK